MSTHAYSQPAASGLLGWFETVTAWLDRRGKLAWIAMIVVGFAMFPPLGLALLAYMIWSKRMFGSCTSRCGFGPSMGLHRSSGNTAFDNYRDETLRRLQEEQASFDAFMERLRAAKDKAEFDQFLDERARAATSRSDTADDETASSKD
ncbi:DUF2852 domain-containing protein [Roseovarius aquimarinus]|uniref:DUF2852 domain-containing protein n=1 Tax=Roseovarius aquimarinus TaxID=1229156 RepID=A0ABW7I3X1_9RHOB